MSAVWVLTNNCLNAYSNRIDHSNGHEPIQVAPFAKVPTAANPRARMSEECNGYRNGTYSNSKQGDRHASCHLIEHHRGVRKPIHESIDVFIVKNELRKPSGHGSPFIRRFLALQCKQQLVHRRTASCHLLAKQTQHNTPALNDLSKCLNLYHLAHHQW